MALGDPFCSGLVFETTPIENGDWVARDYSDGINDAINVGKRIYILLVANTGSTDYANDVLTTVANMTSAQLSNPNVYIVLANYGSGVPFLDPTNMTSSSNDNTVAGALAALKAYRAPGGH